MLTLWKTGILEKPATSASTVVCFSCFRRIPRKISAFINIVTMGKQSKRKIAAKAPTIRNQNNKNVAMRINENTTNLLVSKTLPSPSKVLITFFSNLAEEKQNKNYNIIPKYIKWEGLVLCTLKLKYPIEIEINSLGTSKRNALKNGSLQALWFLKDKDCIKLPNFLLNNIKLSYEYFVKETAKYEEQRKLRLDINKNNATSVNLNIHRCFSTSSKLGIRGQISEKPQHVKHVPPQPPTSIIHNYYSLVSNYYDQDFNVIPHYDHLENQVPQWTCTYVVKWPEEKSFVKTGRTKKESAAKACTEVLQYLNSVKLIDSRFRPIFKEENEARKRTTKIISLKEPTVQRLIEIDNIYKNELLTNLSDNIESSSEPSTEEYEGLFSKQPKIKKFRSLDFYMTNEKTLLPISKFKNEIIDVIRHNQVVIIKGEPGCGKSTRVPQYILEGWAKDDVSNETPCRIVITQPRRIAAISLAERVSNERNERVGQTVGYQVRLQNAFSSKTGRILYCTTGILLRKMQTEPNLTDCSHIVLDEVHERDVNTDLLMNLLRCALKTNTNLKVIAMSATIDTGIFQEYFNEAPIFYVPGFTYPVKQHFIDKCSSIDFSKTLEMCEGKHPNVVGEDVVKAIDYIHRNKGDGAILCFLPGWEDIKTISELLTKYEDMHVLCLHSRLSMKEQKLIFSKPPKRTRKVILSTNIAETSVTIDDVVYVVDTGIQKETKFDTSRGVTCLDNSWISQANIQQRKGRAGRCQPGESFHLYPKQKSLDFDEYPIPEILRTSLTKIVLDSKVCSNNMNAEHFLGQLITPPSDKAIQLAVNELIDLELLDSNENLTSLGRCLANFQLEPKLAKTMVNAIIFKCVTPIIDIVTLFSEEKQLFVGGLYSKDQVKKIKRSFSKISDHLALMKMFEKWLGYVETDKEVYAERFCIANNLAESKLRTLQKLREIHFEYLAKYLRNVLPFSDFLSDNDELVKGVLLSGVGTLIEHSEKLKGKKVKHVLLTRNNHHAVITGESVNGKRSSYSSDYLIYINEVVSNVRKTSIIRETSLISLLTVLLFKSNNIILEELPTDLYSTDINSTDQVLLTLDKSKYKYICDKRQGEILKQCKEALQAIVQYYIFQLTNGGDYNPDVNKDWDRILSILNKTLEEVQI